PAGPAAASIHRLGIAMYAGAALVTLLVTVLMLVPFLRRERRVNRGLFLWGGGVALPLLALTALVPYVLAISDETRAAATQSRLAVDVTGHLWWWDVSYRQANGTIGLRTAN